MGLERYFPEDYFGSRARFRDLLRARGFSHHSYPIRARGPFGEELSIDVGVRGGGASPQALVISSGLHGLEAPFGAACQFALLDQPERLEMVGAQTRVVLIHALNPFGFVFGRRWNEDNIDLGRNFFLPGGDYAGAHPLYETLSPILNPKRPPNRRDGFPIVAAWLLLRYGDRALRDAVPTGQYTHPEGLFYGGGEASDTVRIVDAHLEEWIGQARTVRHLDMHTGLGPWGGYKLLADVDFTGAEPETLAERYGANRLEMRDTSKNAQKAAQTDVAYAARGAFMEWAHARFPERAYTMLTAEFGAYPGWRTLQALRAENQAWRYGAAGEGDTEWARRLAWRAFTPTDPNWRRGAVEQALDLFALAAAPD